MRFKNIKDLEQQIMNKTKLDDINDAELIIDEVDGKSMRLTNIGIGLKDGLYEIAYLHDNGPEMIRIRFEKNGDNIIVKEIVDRLGGPRTDG